MNFMTKFSHDCVNQANLESCSFNDQKGSYQKSDLFKIIRHSKKFCLFKFKDQEQFNDKLLEGLKGHHDRTILGVLEP